MFERKSLKWPITLAVLMIVLLIGLTVGWVLINVFSALENDSSAGLYWVLLSAGSAMFACVVVGVVLYLVLSIQQISLTRRQSNFIDSVTHELKSPIASLKLYLQTLSRHEMEALQRKKFYGLMLDDVARLDQLINHLLDVARLESREVSGLPIEDIDLKEMLAQIVCDVRKQHSVDESCVEIECEEITVRARPADLDILCRNLIDNAVKYAGTPPKVRVSVKRSQREGWARLTVGDNGPGIPRNMRRRVFGRFFRIGNELERKKPGTGLGLFLVRSVIKQMRGRIAITDSDHESGGTQFVADFPIRIGE